MLVGELAGGDGVAERNERVGGVDAPAGDAGVADAELGPAGGGGARVGERVLVPVLGEAQACAALQQQRGARGAGRRIALLAGCRQGGLGIVELVELDERVDERVQRPEHDVDRRGGELVVEAQPRVELGVADPSGGHERHRAHVAGHRERDQPAARPGRVDDRVAGCDRRRELIVRDQREQRDDPQRRVGLGVERAAVERRPHERERDVGRFSGAASPAWPR